MVANVLVNTKDLSREDWLDYRKQGIGGSDVAAILGLNKWKSPIGVYLDKTGEIENEEPGEAAYWGNTLEAVVAKEFETRTGKKVKRRNAILHHPEHTFMLANVDRLIAGENAGLECKTSSEYRKDQWQDDGVPEEYILQCQHYMAVTGMENWYIAVLIGGNKFVYKLIERDQEIIDYLIEAESNFWNNHVMVQIPPEVDGSEASSELLKKLYPDSISGTETMLPSEAIELINKRTDIKGQIKELEALEGEYENKLKDMLKDNEAGLCDGFKITWKSQSRTNFDSKLFKEDFPDLYAKYVNQTSYRKFDIKALKA